MKTKLLPKTANLLLKLPQGVFAAVVTAAILWLTLAPDPLPDNELPLIPGLDKVAHACMFGGFYFAIVFEWVTRHRSRQQKPITWVPGLTTTLAAAIMAIAFGGIIELVQGAMAMGRGCDFTDFIADIAGVMLAVLLTPMVLRAMSERKC